MKREMWLALVIVSTFMYGGVGGYSVAHHHEPTVRTADGTVWARSDLRAYVEGRLADANGRIYCEGLAQDPVQDPFIIEGCKARLAENW